MSFLLAREEIAPEVIETPAFLVFPDVSDGRKSFSVNSRNSKNIIIGQARGKVLSPGILELQYLFVAEEYRAKRTGLADYLLELSARGSSTHLGINKLVLSIINPHIPKKLERMFGEALSYVDLVPATEDICAWRVLPMTDSQASATVARIQQLGLEKPLDAVVDLTKINMVHWELPPLKLYSTD